MQLQSRPLRRNRDAIEARHFADVLAVEQVKDRALVAQRMKAHVAGEDQTPLLIFPEGTCVNNEYCVMFKARLTAHTRP